MLMVLLLAASLAFAQAANEPPPPPELVQAGEAWSQCIGEGLERVGDDVRPAAAADSILAGCRSQQELMIAAHDRWVEGTTMTEREKGDAHRQMRRSVAATREQLVQALRRGRD